MSSKADIGDGASIQSGPALLKEVSLQWPDLPTSSRHIKKAGWELRPVPEELTRVPEDIIIPEKLQQIIKWSLNSGRDWARPPPASPSTRRDSRVKSFASQTDDTREGRRQSKASLAGASAETHPAENPDNKSVSSFKTSLTGQSVAESASSGDTEKSLKTRLLAKIRLNSKSTTRNGVGMLKEGPPKADCTSCFEEYPETEMTRLKSCQHWYCKECLTVLITTAMSAESSFPPKCCLSPIPLQQVLKALDARQREEYQEKAAEYAVPANDRWYCPNTECLKWIPSAKLKINRHLGYNCPHCSAQLCRICRGNAHPSNAECPQDFGLEATLETADVEGWQRCYKCGTMVEHSTGCRHMTCVCKAEFCYVCALQWHTCYCTETDASNKRAEAQRRRQERLEQQDEEAAEIARAIAEVEAMERREAEERREEEERQRLAEEELLVQLEAMRLEEEVRKREEAEQAERDFYKALVISFEEEWNQMQGLYEKVLSFQTAALNSRHEVEDRRLGRTAMLDSAEATADFEEASQTLEKNSEKRRKMLATKQKVDLDALAARQEEEEDDVFLQIQLRLRGKSNKESRMERMLSEIRKQQEEGKQELREKHQTENDELEKKIAVDLEGLQKSHETQTHMALEEQNAFIQKFGFAVGADRQYFEIVLQRRNKMLARHAEKALASLEAREEPVGLTDYEACQIEPHLPGIDDGLEGSSGISRTNAIRTPHGSLRSDRVSERRRSLISQDPREEKIVNTATETDELYAGQGQRTPRQSQIFYPQLPGSFPAGNTHQRPLSIPESQIVEEPEAHQRPHSMQPAVLPARKPVNASSPIDQFVAPNAPRPLSNAAAASLPADLERAAHSFQQDQIQPQPQAQPRSQSQSPLKQQPQQPQQQPQTPQRQESLQQQQHQNQQQQHQQQQQQDIKTAISSVITVEPDGAADYRRSSNTSSFTAAKKSKWPFRKAKEVTEDEMRRKLRASVGDAF